MTAGCHTADPAPAGAACFFCHGHEGIVNFVLPTWDNHPSGTGNYCSHCHDPGWFRPVEYVPPAIVGGVPSVLHVTTNTAEIVWYTDEPASSFVEYGTADPASVAGTATQAPVHDVTLTGLAEGTTYQFRVRSSDAFRNLTLSALAEFRTASAHAPPQPAIVPHDPVWFDSNPQPVTFLWGAVRDPDGDPVEYRVQVYKSATLTPVFLDSGWIPTTTWTANVPAEAECAYYWWRVEARDAAHDLLSPWSVVDNFWGCPND